MSGGSFNYLYAKGADDLVGHNGRADLEDMVDALAALGYAEDAAKESMAILAEVRAAEVRIQAMLDRLSPVWRAMEWWRSYDSDEEGVKRALAKYRGAG
jgi:hypothetical protein